MKTIIFTLLLFAMCVGYGSFCDGWDNGYKDGYCYRDLYCLSPLAPLCPLPSMGQSTYKDGYNRGFLKGLSDK